jgi:hypothetical protein
MSARKITRVEDARIKVDGKKPGKSGRDFCFQDELVRVSCFRILSFVISVGDVPGKKAAYVKDAPEAGGGSGLLNRKLCFLARNAVYLSKPVTFSS